jgi:phage terminase large subunit-like protein
MILGSPELRGLLEVIDSRKTIVNRSNNSSLRVISRDAGSAEGPSYSFVFFDELHAQPDRKLWEALRYSGRSRRQPLICTITTAGSDRQSICWEQHEYAEQVIADPAYDPRFYGRIWAAQKDVDDYFSPEVWRRCNCRHGRHHDRGVIRGRRNGGQEQGNKAQRLAALFIRNLDRDKQSFP